MPSKAETDRMGRVFGDWLRDTGESISTGWGKFKEFYRDQMIRQGQQNVAMSNAALGAGKAVTDWGQETGIPAVKKGYADVQDWSYKHLHDPKKHKKGEHMAYMQQQRNDAHDAMVKKYGPDYRAKQLKKMASDVRDTGVNAYDWVSDQAGDVVDFTTGFARSAYDAATSDPEKPQTALAGSNLKNKPIPANKVPRVK